MDEYQKTYIEDENNNLKSEELKGLGGWLILVGIGLIFSFIGNANQLSSYILFSLNQYGQKLQTKPYQPINPC